MSYLLKFQTSSGVIVEYILKNTKHGCATCYSCRHCLHCRSDSRQNAHQFSTYSNELKLLFVKKKVLKGKENASKDAVPVDEEKISKMLKLNMRKPCLKKSSKLSLNSNSGVDSTKSYDPNLFHNSLKVETFFNNFGENKNVVKSAEAKGMQELNKSSFGQVECTGSDMFPKIKKQFQRSSQKKSESEVQKNFFKLLNVNKTSPRQSLKKSLEISAPCIEKKKEILTENYSRILPQADVEKVFIPDKEKAKSKDFETVSTHLNYHESFLQYVESYLDICIINDKLLEGFDLVQNFRKKTLWKSFVKQKNRNLIYTYNTLLSSLADKGYWLLMNKVLQWMKNDNVKLNSRSFAAILCCLGKVKKYENEKFMEEEIPKVIKQLFANNISLDDIFTKGNLTKQDTEKILTVIQEVVPFFDIKPITINLNSDCFLTRNLYKANTNLKSQVEGLGIDCLENLVEEQMMIERKFLIKVKAVCRGYSGNNSNKKKEKLENLKKQWRYSITKAILKVKREMSDNQHCSHLFDYKIHLNSVPTESLVDILLNFSELLFNYSGGFSPSCAQLRIMLANRVSEYYQLRKKDIIGVTNATENLFKKYADWYLDPKGPAQNSRQFWQMLIQESDDCQIDTPRIRWPKEVISKLGQFMLDIIIKEVKFTVEKLGKTMTYPVFYTLLRYHEGNWREEIKCHPYVESLLETIGFDVLTFRADEIPMVCPPKPWKSTYHGGYLILSTDFVRKPQNIAGKVIKFNEIPLQRLYPTFDSLNALQSIPWMINNEVLDIILEIFKSGGSEELNVPRFPDVKPVEFPSTSDMSYKERMKALFERKKIIQKRNDDYGIWCDTLYRLSLANHYRKRMFWLPQNCDFRGRVYPVPPLLNHLGSDLFRSLLLFAKGKPLGPKGLDWLKIHIINLSGTHKKKSIEERLAYANEIVPVILDSAEKPLTGFKWWAKAEEPWQTLAACMEFKKAVSSPDPEQYICSFPIHQDGSCNGLQHYAALGKDLIGAKSVNLASFKTPQDVYSVVAELVEEERKKDAAAGVEIAVVLDKFIERKIVKQTVMTTVYGVTHYGAKIQIRKRLEEIPDFPQEYISPASSYIADKIFLCLKKMFTSAKNIQDWFINCADVICSMNEYVEWTSPLGLPVLQSYGKYRNCYKLNKIIVPNKVKQKNAFPPNFIHSLDSCHMMLTSLYCEQAGLTFAAVHDCFWTHPCNVDSMNKICREQFISLHSQPILEDLSRSFKRQYLGNCSENNKNPADVFEAIPKKGDFDVNEIMNSVYFFS